MTTHIPSLEEIMSTTPKAKGQPITSVPFFCRVINDIVKGGKLARVKHHLGDTYYVREAKPLGFGTRNAMIRLDKAGWVTVDPITHTIETSDRNA